MKYAVVATPRYLLCVDLVTKNITPIEGTRGEYYGISWFPNKDPLVLSHSVLDHEAFVDLASYAQSEVGYISAGPQESRPVLSAPHQILCAPDGRVICTNTGRNVITVIDLEKPGFFQEASVGPARWDRFAADGKIGEHMNSIFLKNDQLFVICHRFNQGSHLATFAYPSLELISLKPLDGFTGLHNIWVTEDGQQISCNSESGTVVDLATGNALWEAGKPCFTRGIAANNEYVLIGESQKTKRPLRSSTMSGLWILERHSWKVLDYLCLGPFGNVNEVRLLDSPDEAHHGHSYQGLDALLQRNMLQDIVSQSLASYAAVAKTKEFWKDYKLILGAPETLADGAKKSDNDNLCLAIMRQPTNTFTFDYTLSRSTMQAHVSAVIGYQGSHDDTHMHAILLQRNEDSASVSIWQHNGTGWHPIPGISVNNLPLVGIMKTTILNNKISVYIQQNEVLSLDADLIGLTNYHLGYGIRWIGATVKPRTGNSYANQSSS